MSLRCSAYRTGVRLAVFTVTWNVVEAVVAVGIAIGSVALIGFGAD